MARKPPDTSTVLKILVDRICLVPAEQTARGLGYRAKTISDIASRYQLDDFEKQIRIAITGQAGELSPEAIKLNEECDAKLSEITELMYSEVEDMKADRHNDPNPPTLRDRIARVSFLELTARGIEASRVSRLKIAGLTAENKKRQASKNQESDVGFKSDYADLANDAGDDDD